MRFSGRAKTHATERGRWASSMRLKQIQLVAAVATALLLPTSARSLQSPEPEFTSYVGILFQNTTLQGLEKRLGKGKLFDPPGEVLLPDEMCYGVGKLRATFFIEHYGRNRSTSTVTGVVLSRHTDGDDAGALTTSPTCSVPKIGLSECIGRLCLGDSIAQVMKVMRKEMTYPGSYEWVYYDVALSPEDLVVRAYPDAIQTAAVPDWMYPSHIVRVQISNGIVTAIYVAIDVDMA